MSEIKQNSTVNTASENKDEIPVDQVREDWWFIQFQRTYLQPVETVIVILLIFLFIRWISLSGYPIFGVLWTPLFLYFGRGMNAFFERVNASKLKKDDTGLYWELFDPIQPVDPESDLNPNAPPIVGNIKIYAATSRFMRFWVALLQVFSALINGTIAYFGLLFRLPFSLFYLFHDNKWIQEHGIDGFYLISQTPLNVWADEDSVRGSTPDGPQTDAQGNSMNFMTTILQRLNWVATLGMDRTLYANLHLLPIFRVTESRWSWLLISLAMWLFITKGFNWTGAPANPEFTRFGWYFFAVWFGVLLWSWWHGGFQFWASMPAIRSFFMGEEETWGKSHRMNDFFRPLLRNQYDRNEGSLPTRPPLPEELKPKQFFTSSNITQENTNQNIQTGGQAETTLFQKNQNYQYPEMNQNQNENRHSQTLLDENGKPLPATLQNGNNAIARGINRMDEANRVLLPTGSWVPSKVTSADATYYKKVIPTMVYEAQIMEDKREQERVQKEKLLKQMEELAKANNQPKTNEQKQKSLADFAVALDKGIEGNQKQQQEEPESSQPQNNISQNIEKERVVQIEEEEADTEEQSQNPQQPPQQIQTGGGFHQKKKKHSAKEMYKNAQRITPITWIPVPTSWMSGIPQELDSIQ
jgi:hypothetical protein